MNGRSRVHFFRFSCLGVGCVCCWVCNLVMKVGFTVSGISLVIKFLTSGIADSGDTVSFA